MTVHLGPFHPYLEDALVREVLASKADAPFCPVLIVVPSDEIRRRVAWLFAAERRLALLGLHILTFHQLSRRLYAEKMGDTEARLCDEGLFEELVRHVLRSTSAPSPFSGLVDTPGGCAALWQTLRDLKDSRVDPEHAQEAIRFGLFGDDETTRLDALFSLYRSVLDTARGAGWLDYTELDALAVECVPHSAFLTSCARIMHYGAYDLTQTQYDFFQAVARNFETTLFFPLVAGHPGWAFAERFYQRYIQGLPVAQHVRVEGPPSAVGARLFVEAQQVPASGADRPTIWSCCGARDEVVTTAKEILRLVEEEGLGFGDIGVVARSLEPYRAWISREFSLHAVPHTTTAKQPLAAFPLAHAVGSMLEAASGNPTRDQVIDLFASPFFAPAAWLEGARPRPDVWERLSRQAGITEGFAAWSLLEGLRRDQDDDQGVPPGSGELDEQRTLLSRLVSRLERACAALPHQASGAEHAAAWRELLETVLGLVTRGEATPDPTPEERQAAMLLAAFQHPAALDPVRPTMSRADYLDAVRRRIDAASLPAEGDAPGVRVLDAMAARALPFRALFILGVNEGVFPRLIREDSLLPDHERRVLERDLGYKIPEKLAGYDEERLLFALLGGAVRERLYVLFQRSDETGRVTNPSWYVHALCRAVGLDGPSDLLREIPRRLRDRYDVPPFDRPERLTPTEAAVRAVLNGEDPESWMDSRAGRTLVARGRAVLQVVERARAPLGAHDGWVGPLPALSAEIRARKFSATALEAYARCPLRFFFSRVLGIETINEPNDEGPGAAAWGRLCHDILAEIYRDGDGRLRALIPRLQRVDAACDAAFSRYAQTQPIGYPLLWEMQTAVIRAALREVVADDLDELRASGYAPVATETTVEGTLPAPVLPITGRLDRIDHHPDGRVRVIDFKLGGSRNTSNLVTAALRGERLQPPLYAALGVTYGSHLGLETAVVEVALYVISAEAAPALTRLAYRPNAEEASRIGDTIATLVEGIDQGRFAMIPGSYCSRCSAASMCRRRHRPSELRAARDERLRPHLALRRASVRSVGTDA